MKNLVVLIGLALVGCSSAKPRADDAPKAPDGPIALTFAWPPGLSGTMKLDATNQKDAERTRAIATYGLSTTQTEEGVALAYDAREIELPGLPEQVRAMTEALFRAVPTLVLRGGTVAGIRDFDRAVQLFGELMAPLYETTPELKGQFDQFFTEETMLASAQEEWEWRATAWHGRTMSVGETVEEELDVQLALIGAQARARVSMTLKELIPCPGAAERQCVRLERVLVIDDDEAKAALGRLGAVFDSGELERTLRVELVAEPSTLLTYQMIKDDRTVVKMVRDGTETVGMSRKQSEEIYTWK